MIDVNLLLAWGATYKKISSHETIFTEGQSCTYYYQLISGIVKWINIDSEGHECIQSIIEPGESFGEFPLFDDDPYAATAIAESNCILIKLYKPTFIEMLRGNPDLLFAFTRLLTKRLRFKYSIIKSYASNNPETRIINLINYLKAENKCFCGECDQLKLTRQQIADMCGLRVETVIRTIRSMHNKGNLVISRGKVYCKDILVTLEV